MSTLSSYAGTVSQAAPSATERQVTKGPGGRILTNTGVWSPDSQWIVFDTRSDPAGDVFDADAIQAVKVATGEVRTLYRSQNGAHCGVVTFHPRERKVVFILGPENPTPDWSYNAYHRQGVIVDWSRSGVAINLDARDITPPFTPGALRGGSHVHVWHPRGDWVSFTYEDHVLSEHGRRDACVTSGTECDLNQRNVGVSAPISKVKVGKDHPRNHDGTSFSVLVTRTVNKPKPGTDEIMRAFEEGWVGTDGYVRSDGSRQRRALAFQGQVIAASGQPISEVFILDLPEDLTREDESPLCGTEDRRPAPPRGTVQRRLTFTIDRRYPGLQGPRHWLRSSPDGSRIAFLMKDDAGLAQLWTVSPNGGAGKQLTTNAAPIASAFTWRPDGQYLAHVMEGSVCITDAATGRTSRLTPRYADAEAPRPEACVFSPDGKQIAYVRRVADGDKASNQIFVAEMK